MDQVVKEKWVKALRSGEYEQTTGYLADESGFCCLGVLCELAVKEGVIAPPTVREFGSRVRTYADEESILPTEVTGWSGLPDDVGRFADADSDGYYRNEIEGYTALAELNDEAGYTFAALADVIEERF